MDEKLGRYQIIEEIGQGGFATVYRAHDAELDRSVAVKELKPALLQDKTWIKRFQREARAVARLDHPHIITIYDVVYKGDCFVIVMRLVNGPSLDKLIAARTHLSWAETLAYMADIAAGLDYAHSQNILHRDLKPANILIDPERGPVLSDFGLAKLMKADKSSMTATGSIAGTPHYIAPEIWEEKEATPQTDIYALGCILYEMLTGAKVFKGETPPAVMMAHFKPLELPTRWPLGVPPAVSDVLRAALARNPADRYQSANQMVAALNSLSTADLPAIPAPVETQPSVETAPAASPTTPPELSSYDNVKELVRQVTQEVVAETRRDQAATWKHEAESALTTGYFDSAERAARKWQELSPSDPDLPSFWQRLEQTKTQPECALPLTPFHPTLPAPPGLSAAKKKKMGCLWRIIGAAVVLLALVGVCTVCSQLHLLEQLFPDLPVGPTVTEAIHVPRPNDGAETPNLTINFTTGDLVIIPGAENALVDGTATYNMVSLKPRIVTQGQHIAIEQEGEIDFWNNLANAAIEDNWTLKLGDTPMVLTLKTGVSTSKIELGGLSLVDLNMNQGGSNFELSFAQPNRVEMNELVCVAGASEATLRGLANANARRISFVGGAGSYTLDFSGQLQRDSKVNVQFGLGNTTLIVPKDTPARVSGASTQKVTLTGAWQQSGNEYVLPGAGPQLDISVTMGAGHLTLSQPGDIEENDNQ